MPFLVRRPMAVRMRTFALAVASLAAVSCGGGGEITGTGGTGGTGGSGGTGGTGGATPTPASSVGVSPDTATVPVGTTRQLTATPRDVAGAALTGRTVTWTSSSATVATVVEGLVTAMGAGSATITATADGKVGTATVTVPTPVSSVAVTPATASLIAGGTQQLAASVKDAAGNTLAGRTVVWSTSSAAVVTVNPATGLVTAVAAGTATITATSETRTGTATVTVSAAPVGQGSISAGFEESCALTTAGAAWCWGANFGVEPPNLFNGSKYPLAVPGGLVFTSVSTGLQHACGLTAGGIAYCWGRNSAGELGNGNAGYFRSDTPVAVAGGLRFASIHAGAAVTMALTADGKAWGWGYNQQAQLGDGSVIDRGAPSPVAGGLTFRAVATTGGLTVGLIADGTPYYWGTEFGEPYTAVTMAPRRVEGTATLRFASIDVSFARAIALTTAGEAYEWGSSVVGYGGRVTTPVRVAQGRTFVRAETGISSYGITAGGQVYAWGDNTYGQLGDGTTTYRGTPVLSAGGRIFRSFAAGDRHAIGLDADGLSWAWGSNQHGQFGNGANNLIVHTATPPSVSEFSLQVSPATPTLNAGQSVDLTVLVTRRGGGFTTTGAGIGLPGAVTVAITNLPSGVTSSVTQAIIAADQSAAGIRLTAASSVAGGSASVTLSGATPGFPTRTTALPILMVSSTGSTGLNLVCPASGATPTSFPAGYHCMTNSAGQNVPGKFDVPTLTGSPWWVDETAAVCVSWRNDSNRGLSTARFKAALGGGATTVTNGRWGLIVRASGIPEGQTNAQPLFTSNLDAQTQLLSFNPTLNDNVINNYNFRRSSTCPW